jgi:RNA recognition motif-containing protein
MKDIFVGNLDYKTSEDELRQLFAAYGPVDRVSIVTDRCLRGDGQHGRCGQGDHRTEWYSTPRPQAGCQ